MRNTEGIPNPEQDPRENLQEAVNGILEKERFTLAPEVQQEVQEQIESDRRYICVVGMREENGGQVRRFLKIPVCEPEEEKIDEKFNRQVKLAGFLKEDGRVKTRGVVVANLNRAEGLPYAIMETFEPGEAKIGFITSDEDNELLTKREAQSCVETLGQLHSIDTEKMPKDVKGALQVFSGSAEEFFDSIKENLYKIVRPLDNDSKEEPYHQVLNRRLNVPDFKEKVEQLINVFKDVVKKQEGGQKILVHGDLAPDALYVYDNGEVEFLDLEFSGICDNEVLAMIIDFGNMRVAAWNNEEFKEALDEAILKKYKKEEREDAGKAIVALGILFSHMRLAGYFENDPLDEQREEGHKSRREITEANIAKAWKIAGIKF